MREFNYSVIIPFRDKLDLLIKAINSIPDREDIEIIAVDNSDIPFGEPNMPVLSKARLVYLTSDPTKGAGHARNVGLMQMKGLFLICLDADDYFMPNAFTFFDRYLEQDYDIVFFDADSIKLSDGSRSTRHETIHRYITGYHSHHKEDSLRYRFVNPICKMIRTDLIKDHSIQFDETPVANDAMFSVKAGHYARKVTACDEVVYMITEGDSSSSLTKAKSAKNQFIRFQVAVRRYQFVTSVGRKDQQPKLISFVGHAFLDFGFKEGIKWVKYAHEQGIKLL